MIDPESLTLIEQIGSDVFNDFETNEPPFGHSRVKYSVYVTKAVGITRAIGPSFDQLCDVLRILTQNPARFGEATNIDTESLYCESINAGSVAHTIGFIRLWPKLSHIRNTPNRGASSTGAFKHAASASPKTSRVCAGSITPSSHSRAVA